MYALSAFSLSLLFLSPPPIPNPPTPNPIIRVFWNYCPFIFSEQRDEKGYCNGKLIASNGKDFNLTPSSKTLSELD
ncbi:hypothetical protein CEXT_628701 [Caerostris extrusa]|uniref:Uncharacterized protein n=1 Tax=Caerostris extrusa TaxID=172846 RepID=A0AAV4U752_CAEEX|nr:hypothetical protein CEXT_628701 [Caerostris extrusa]